MAIFTATQWNWCRVGGYGYCCRLTCGGDTIFQLQSGCPALRDILQRPVMKTFEVYTRIHTCATVKAIRWAYEVWVYKEAGEHQSSYINVDSEAIGSVCVELLYYCFFFFLWLLCCMCFGRAARTRYFMRLKSESAGSFPLCSMCFDFMELQIPSLTRHHFRFNRIRKRTFLSSC